MGWRWGKLLIHPGLTHPGPATSGKLLAFLCKTHLTIETIVFCFEAEELQSKNRGWREVEEGKEEINGDGRRLAFGW